MKKYGIFGFIGLACLALASCSNSGDKLEKKNVYGLNKDEDIITLGNCELLFKKDSTIPYVSLTDGVFLMDVVRKANLDDQKYFYKLEHKGNEYIIKNENNATCVIDKEKQNIKYEDYDMFTSIVPDTQKPLSMTNIKKKSTSLKLVESKYTKGNSVNIDLTPYTKLDIYQHLDKCYLPLSVFNELLLNPGDNVNLAYNTKDLFIANPHSFTVDLGGIEIPTQLGEKFKEGFKNYTITDEYSEYYFQTLCMDFDIQYGLKSKFTNFAEFLEKYKLKEGFKTTDPKELDNYTVAALSNLVDCHTTLAAVSASYEKQDNKIDLKLYSEEKRNYEVASQNFQKAKAQAKIKDGIEYIGNTAFVSFNNFTNIDEDLLYLSKIDVSDFKDDFPGLDDLPGLDFGNEAAIDNTAILFNKLYTDLSSDAYKNTIKNIVIDLTTNEGGASDSLLYALSTLIGEVKTTLINSLTEASNTQTYMADINADGKIDSNDIPLINKGFNIVFLDSKYTYSSGNAMPVLAKLNNNKVHTLGDTTGGGACAVRYTFSPIANAFSSSSLNTISKLVDGKYQGIEDGAPAEVKLTEQQMLDRNFIVNNLDIWFK